MTTILEVWPSRLTQRELKAVKGLQLEEAQLAWSAKLYLKNTLYPNAQDFVEWSDNNEPPSVAVCKGFLSEVPVAVQMAEKLQTLEAAWYPTAETRKEIEYLKERLTVAL